MPDRVLTNEQRDELRIIMLEAGVPLIKEFGVTHTTISKITEVCLLDCSKRAEITKKNAKSCRDFLTDSCIKLCIFI